MSTRRYETSDEFKIALEEKLGYVISPELWDVIVEFLFVSAVHEPYSDGDVLFALPKIRKMIRLFSKNNPDT